MRNFSVTILSLSSQSYSASPIMKFQATLCTLAAVVATTLAAGVADLHQDIQTMIRHTNMFDADVIGFSRGPITRFIYVPSDSTNTVELSNMSSTGPPL